MTRIPDEELFTFVFGLHRDERAVTMKWYGLWRENEDGGSFLMNTGGWLINYPSRVMAQIAADLVSAVNPPCEVREFPSDEDLHGRME